MKVAVLCVICFLAGWFGLTCYQYFYKPYVVVAFLHKADNGYYLWTKYEPYIWNPFFERELTLWIDNIALFTDDNRIIDVFEGE